MARNYRRDERPQRMNRTWVSLSLANLKGTSSVDYVPLLAVQQELLPPCLVQQSEARGLTVTRECTVLATAMAGLIFTSGSGGEPSWLAFGYDDGGQDQVNITVSSDPERWFAMFGALNYSSAYGMIYGSQMQKGKRALRYGARLIVAAGADTGTAAPSAGNVCLRMLIGYR